MKNILNNEWASHYLKTWNTSLIINFNKPSQQLISQVLFLNIKTLIDILTIPFILTATMIFLLEKQAMSLLVHHSVMAFWEID